MDSTMVSLNNTIPDVDAGVDSVINCINTLITLSGSSQTTNVSFSWSTSNGNIVVGANTANPVVDAGGTYVLTVTDSVNGCEAMDSVMIIMDITPPDANAGPDTTLTCVVTQVTLSGSSTTPGALFAWVATNGGAILSGANTATPLVQIPGTYVLTVTNPVNGCTAQDSADVHYDNTVPDVDAGGDMMLNCVVSSTTMNGNTTTAGAFIMWTTLDGNIVSGSTTLDPTVDMAGTYVLTITHPTSGCVAIDTALVILNTTIPDVDAGIDTIIGCGIDSVSLHGSTTANAGMNWTTIGGHIVSGASTADPVIDAAGTYILTVIDRINGCSASDTVIVELSEPPVVDLGDDTTVIFCQGFITLDAGNPGMEYMWNTGDTTQTINVSVTGMYYVTVTNEFGCPASDTINVTVNPTNLIVDLGNDTTFMNCNALPFVLDAGNPGATYVWSTTEITQTIVVTTSGMYFVTVTDSLGCSASDTINVTIIDNDIDVDLGNDTTVCGCIELSAGNPGASYSWCSGENYAIINVCVTGVYCVTVSNGTCTDADTIHVTVLPELIVDLGNDTSLVAGNVVLDAGNPGSDYLWSTGDTTQMITVTQDGQYYVTVTNAGGCVESDTINVGIVGVTETPAIANTVNVYPNPSADGSFTLDFNMSESADVEIRMLNVLGEVVYYENLKKFNGAYNKQITLDRVSKGIYFINVVSSKHRSTNKLIIE
jgi:hypothetical protein